MRLHLSLAIVGMLVGGLTPTFAQSGTLSTKDQQLLAELGKNFDTAYNKKDTAGLLALYAEDGVAITPTGIVQGRAALQKWIEADLQAGGHDLSSQNSSTRAHALGDAFWSFGDWSTRYGDQTLHGHWSNIIIRVGDTLKIQQNTINLALPETGSASAK